MNTPHALTLVPSLLVLAVPAVFAVGAFASAAGSPLRRGAGFSVAALAVAAFACFLQVLVTGGIAGPPSPASSVDAFPLAARLATAVHLDAVTGTMLVLVCFLAACIARFSVAYLDRAPGAARYASSLLATLAAVTTLVTSSHLLVIAAAWTATSLALHQLLTFHPERRQALVAAHKKFLLSRLADVSILAAVALLWSASGSLVLGDIGAWASASQELPAAGTAAALLLVVAVALKSAQAPFHGWLIQVMEAPTPVSALLHAGVVNLGGFLLIRLAPLMEAAPAAQVLLAAIGTSTAVVAALVLRTRVSVKVALAWSTCAQMGMMLVQCALGAWPMALLHIVGHSLYKAHSFLRSGSRVEEWKAAALRSKGKATAPPAMTAACLLVMAALYVAWHSAVAAVPGLAAAEATSPLAAAIAVAGLAVLLITSAALEKRPTGRLATALRPRLFAGFYLDEIFTRATFRLWPPKLPPRAEPEPALQVAGAGA